MYCTVLCAGVVENVPEAGTGNIDLEIETNSVDSSGSRYVLCTFYTDSKFQLQWNP